MTGGAAARRPRFAALLLALIAAGCGPDAVRDRSEPLEEGPAVSVPAPAAARPSGPEEASAERIVYGAVVTDFGDGIPMVAVRWGDRVVGRTNTYGEFGVFVPADEAGELVFSHDAFATAVEDVAPGPQPTERLVRLLARSPPIDARTFFVYLRDPSGRGFPGARLRLVDPETRVLLLDTHARFDGTVTWPEARGFDREVEARVWMPGWPREDVVTLRVRHGIGIPVNATVPRVSMTHVVVERPELFGAPVRVSVHTDTGYTINAGYEGLRYGHSFPGGLGEPWALVRAPRRVLLRPLVAASEPDTLAARATPGAVRLVFEREGALARSVYPYLQVTIGRPWIVAGQSANDILDWPYLAPARIPLVARGTDLITPPLDFADCCLSLRGDDPSSDARVVARVPIGDRLDAREPGLRIVSQPLHVLAGTGRVTCRYVPGYAGDAACDVTLARRGGAYRATRRLRPGETVEWTGLSAGSFLLWRSVAASVEPLGPGAAPVVGMEEMRVVAVEPGVERETWLRGPEEEPVRAVFRRTREKPDPKTRPK